MLPLPIVKINMNHIINTLNNCNLCPRECEVNRTQNELGFCKVGSQPLVASITLHRGEEPVISGKNGICNVFFAHCNLACIFCQNHPISKNSSFQSEWISDYDIIISQIIAILKSGTNMLGFVSPTHQIPQMVTIINKLKDMGYSPRIVYNTNCFENPHILRELSQIVDIYLPDIKYFDNYLGEKYSCAPNYFTTAIKALEEMIWQKGTSILIDDEGTIESGVVLRHLVLPGHSADSIKIFEYLAHNISSNITISLMSQYHPVGELPHPLNRTVTTKEYMNVVRKVEDFGFHRGWIQDIDSNSHYLPNFSSDTPFVD